MGAWLRRDAFASQRLVEDARGRAAILPGAMREVRPIDRTRHTALLVDLNNFATFPTLAVGILIAALRNAGHEVRLLVPLAYDVPASERERVEWWLDHWMRRIHLSTWAPARWFRDMARGLRYWWRQRPHRTVLREVARAIEAKPDVLLLSAYLQHHATVVEIGKLARAAGIPLLLGGPAFNLKGVADAWRTVPGLTAIFGGEADLLLPELIAAIVCKDDLLKFDGIVLPDGERSRPAPPFRALDSSPVPDFSDFPWDRYRVRIVPIMTGRGCQWAKCSFCSDVVSANGRTYRTRSLESVLHEMREQSRRQATSNFLFLDLKLNSNPALFRGIAEHAQDVVPGAQWIGTVHVDTRADNGLSRADLRAAAASGMRRVSFGLESGSQRMLDLMTKGATVEANSMFIRHAFEAGISVRCTMFKGYPGETAEDLERSARFLEEHLRYIDRVRFNEFSILEDTPIWAQVHAGDLPDIEVNGAQARLGRISYLNRSTQVSDYRRAKARVLGAVFAINRRRLAPGAQMFDGMM
ncbi:radical SAM protein [Sphingomonas sp. JC676]|uniref:B12-binding domain-containing radical SAM protein n=1 Tax=Sphingomonas sp. JC676 TaxID=2768065 RepID=UPI001657FF04|nr:radical SAM protein [Sphingomonas sp. JC676]MBC9032932.1 radical SAM protein [Sphingomonas sp. JC676]